MATAKRGRFASGWHALRTSIFWTALRRQSSWLVATVVLAIATAGITALTAQAAAAVVDRGIVEQTDPIGGLVGRLIILALIELFLGAALRIVSERIAWTLDLDLRNVLYLRLQRATPRELDRFPTGQVVTRSLADLESLQNFIQIIQLQIFVVPILVGLTIFLFLQSPIMAVIAVSGLVVNGILVNKIRHRLWGLSYLQLDQTARITSAVDEPVRGVRVVKAFGREAHERERVAAASATSYQYSMTRERFRAKYDILFKVAPTALRFLVLIVGARLVVSGSLSVGEFGIVFTFVGIFTGIADALDLIVSAFQYTKTGAGRMTELLRTGGRRPVRGWESLPEPSTGLEMYGAGVAYGDVLAVDNVSLRVPPGRVTMLTGPPGSGKSTVAGLATGTFAPTSGQVLLDGVDLQRLDPADVRTAVHFVSEDPFLFGRTVRENLVAGVSSDRPPATPITDEALSAAVHAAAADDVLAAIGGGLDAVLGDRGLTLSGGQRQRLALARALVAPPRVLVLDDALSAVSPALEIEIIGRIRAHAPETGILCIGRRASLHEVADEIVELPEREIQEDLTPLTVSGVDVDDARSAIRRDRPYNDQLVGIIDRIELTDDKPLVPRELAETPQPFSMGNLLKPITRTVVVFSLLTLVAELVGLIPEYLLGDATDYVQQGRELREAGDNAAAQRRVRDADKLALGTLGVAVVGAAAFYFARIRFRQMSANVVYTLRTRVFARLSNLGVSYFDREMPGSVATKVVTDVNEIDQFFDRVADGAVRSILRLVGALTIMTILVPQVGLITFGFIVVVAVLTAIQAPLSRKAFLAERLTLGDVVTRQQEDFAARDIISGYGGERRARGEFGQLNRRHRDARIRSALLRATFSPLIGFVRDVAAAMVYLRAGNLVVAGALTTGTVITLRLYVSTALDPVPRMAGYWQSWLRAKVHLNQLNEPFQVPVLPAIRDDARPVEAVEGAITFENVTFGYPGVDRPVLHDVTFSIAPGDRVAVVGHTGAGKSSVAKLLGRIYDPDGGRILVDDADIRDLDLSAYRRRLGVVPQDAFVFRGTVASNIAYGRPEASREEIEEAARLAGAYDTLAAMEGGLDAPVEEEGRNLTAAERQLIALARAVLADPDILVLDEATSSLDAATEARVIEAMFALERTTLLVTHRLPIAERADLVLMIDDGRIVDAGSHEELVASSSGYVSLWGNLATRGPRGRRTRRTEATTAPAKKATPTRRKAGVAGEGAPAPATNGSAKAGRAPKAAAKAGKATPAPAKAARATKAAAKATKAAAKTRTPAKKVVVTPDTEALTRARKRTATSRKG